GSRATSGSGCWAGGSRRTSSWRSAARLWERFCGPRGPVERESADTRLVTPVPVPAKNDIVDALTQPSQQLHQAMLAPVASGPSIATRIQDFFSQWAT